MRHSIVVLFFFFFSSRRRHTRYWRDWSSDVCSSDLPRRWVLVDIVLIKTNSHRLGINLDQFGQRILQAARNGYSSALGSIKGGKFLARRFGGRINGGSGLVDDDVANLALLATLRFDFADQPGHQLLGFTRGGAIADSDNIDLVFLDQPAQDLGRALRLVQVHGVRLDIFAGLIDDG